MNSSQKIVARNIRPQVGYTTSPEYRLKKKQKDKKMLIKIYIYFFEIFDKINYKQIKLSKSVKQQKSNFKESLKFYDSVLSYLEKPKLLKALKNYKELFQVNPDLKKRPADFDHVLPSPILKAARLKYNFALCVVRSPDLHQVISNKETIFWPNWCVYEKSLKNMIQWMGK